MSKPSAAYIRRQRASGVKLKSLCEQHSIGMVELREILGMPKVVKTKRRVSEWDAAIAELKAEGYTAEQIAAVFGE
jgi:hypothetical protein